MKECLFCFETMVDSESVCSSCKNLQPSKLKTDRQYRFIIRWLAISEMGIRGLIWGIIFGVVLSLPLAGLLASFLHSHIQEQPLINWHEAAGTWANYLIGDPTLPNLFDKSWKVLGLILVLYFIRKIYKMSLVEAVSTKGYFIETYLRKHL